MARPLHLPTHLSGHRCPVTGGTVLQNGGFSGVAQGPGVVHPLAGPKPGVADLTSTTEHPGWLAFKTLWFSSPRYQGPFLVRVRRLGGGPAGLLEDPRRSEFYIPAGNGTLTTYEGYREVPGATWVKTPGCVGWQVDGTNFSKVIIVRADCRPPTCALTRRHAGR